MADVTFASVASIVVKVCGMVVRAGKPAHGFPVVRVSKSQQSGQTIARVPTAETLLIAKRTGVDLSIPADLARVVLASAGSLFTDGVRVWDATAEGKRKSEALKYRNTSTALRNEYRAAAIDATDEALENIAL